jgi:hypothetical protein
MEPLLHPVRLFWPAPLVRASDRRALDRLALLVLLLVAAVQLGTLRAGHEWGDDFALYVRHAQNLVEGRAYADTGYIDNPFAPPVSPRAYPPLFPFLLVPVYALFGLNLLAMKAALVLVFLGLVWVCYRGFRNQMPAVAVLLLTAMVGFHPYFAGFKNHVLSDLPFAVFVCLCLFRHEQLAAREENKPVLWSEGLLGGLLLYLAYATRTVGVVLALALLVSDMLQTRRLRPSTIAALVLFAVLALVQNMLLPGGYLDHVGGNVLGTMAANARNYAEAFFDMWGAAVPRAMRAGLLLPLGLLAVTGFITTARQRVSSLHTFTILYVLTTLAWPSYQAGRFLLPLLPLMFYFALTGCQALGRWLPYPAAPLTTTGLVVLTVVVYLAGYRTLDRGPIATGIADPAVQQCLAFVRDTTPKEAVFVFTKPRALALLTGRSASTYHVPATDAELWDHWRRIGAEYVIVGDFPRDRAFLASFLERAPERWREVFANSAFRVLRLRS